MPEIAVECTRTTRYYTVTGADNITRNGRVIVPARLEIHIVDDRITVVDVIGPVLLRSGSAGRREGRVWWGRSDCANAPRWVADVITRDGLVWREAHHA